jgi:hypothetical protein
VIFINNSGYVKVLTYSGTDYIFPNFYYVATVAGDCAARLRRSTVGAQVPGSDSGN